MISDVSEKIANFLVDNCKNADIDKSIITYGLNTAINQSISICSFVVLGFLMGLWLEVVVFLASLSFLRPFAGGYHCDTALKCYILSLGAAFSSLILVKFTTEELIPRISLTLLMIAVPFICKFAPIGTKNKPLDETECKYYRKITIRNLIIECILILIFLGLQQYYIVYSITLAIALVAGALALQMLISQNEISFIDKC